MSENIDDKLKRMKGVMKEIPLFKVEEPPLLMHPDASEQELAELGHSIKNVGLIEPIVVRKKDDHYQLICGFMRVMAAKKVGITSLQGKIVDMSEEESLAILAEENLSRYAHNPYAEIQLCDNLHREKHMNVDEIAKKFGWSESWVQSRLKASELPQEILNEIANRRLSITVANMLHKLPSDDLKRRFGYDFANKSFSTNMAQAVINNFLAMQETLKRPVTEEEREQILETPQKTCEICEESKPITEFTFLHMCNDCRDYVSYLKVKDRREREKEKPPEKLISPASNQYSANDSLNPS